MTTYLSPEELTELKKLCSDPMLELGMTLRPKHMKCFETHMVTTSVSLVIHFSEEEDARYWNLMNETRIRYTGHVATVALATMVALVGGGLATSIAVGASTAIVKDEIQAKVWYPHVAKDWTLTRSSIFHYQQFPMKNFSMRWTDTIRDENGNVYEERKHDNYNLEVGGNSGIPEPVVKDIMTRFPQYKYVEFKAKK